MATVNPRMLRSRGVRVLQADSIDDLPDAANILSVIDGDLYLTTADGGLVNYGSGSAVPRVSVDSAEVLSTGLTIQVTFDGEVEADDYGAGFALLVDGEEVEFESAEIQVGGTDLHFTVAYPVNDEQEVVVRFNGSTMRAKDGQKVKAFTKTATNNSEVAYPSVESATLGADGVTLTLVLSENVESPSEAPETGFAVTVNGEPVEVLGATLTDDEIEFALDPIGSDAVIKLSYTAGEDAGDIRSASSSELQLRSFKDYEVTNNSELNPVVESAKVETDGETLTITFSKNVSSPDGEAGEGFVVLVDNEPVEILGASLVDDTLELTIPKVAGSQGIALSYTAGEGAGDIVGADTAAMPLLSFEGLVVENESALAYPEISSAVLAADGTTLTVTFSENMESPSSAPEAGFAVTVNGDPVEVEGAVLTDDELALTIPETASDAVLTVSYTAGEEAGDLRSVATEWALASAENVEVVNNSEVAPPEPEPEPEP